MPLIHSPSLAQPQQRPFNLNKKTKVVSSRTTSLTKLQIVERHIIQSLHNHRRCRHRQRRSHRPETCLRTMVCTLLMFAVGRIPHHSWQNARFAISNKRRDASTIFVSSFQQYNQRYVRRNIKSLPPSTFLSRILQSNSDGNSIAVPSLRRWAATTTADLDNESGQLSTRDGTCGTIDHPTIDNETMEWLLQNWRDQYVINPTLQFETWLVPSRSLSKVIKEPSLQPLMANAHSNNNGNVDGGHHHHGENNSSSEDNIILQHIHPRIKMIQDYSDSHKLLLRSPVTIVPPSSAENTSDAVNSSGDAIESDSNMRSTSLYDSTVEEVLKHHQVTDGPLWTTQVSYRNLSLQYIISQLLQSTSDSSNSMSPPIVMADLPTAYEQVGHIAHFNFKREHLPMSRLVGQVLVDIHPTVEMVVHKVGQVTGPYRTYPLEVLATKAKDVNGKNCSDSAVVSSTGTNNVNDEESSSLSTETTLMEHGLTISLDIAKCYWCSRLSGERQVILSDISSASSTSGTNGPLLISDVFCGVGTLCMLANREMHCHVLANDWNPSAIEYFRRNLEQNSKAPTSNDEVPTSRKRRGDSRSNSTSSIDPSMFALSCVDSYEYLMDLGLGNIKLPQSMSSSSPPAEKGNENVNIVLPHHIIMNYPLEAPTFLGALRWWPAQVLQELEDAQQPLPRFHVYTFARADRDESDEGNQSKDTDRHDDKNGGTRRSGDSGRGLRTEEDVAIDLVANSLLPGVPGEDGPQTFRAEQLNRDYNAELQTRIIRDVAPGKVCLCVSFTLTSKLIRHMQGDYDDDE